MEMTSHGPLHVLGYWGCFLFTSWPQPLVSSDKRGRSGDLELQGEPRPPLFFPSKQGLQPRASLSLPSSRSLKIVSSSSVLHSCPHHTGPCACQLLRSPDCLHGLPQPLTRLLTLCPILAPGDPELSAPATWPAEDLLPALLSQADWALTPGTLKPHALSTIPFSRLCGPDTGEG